MKIKNISRKILTSLFIAVAFFPFGLKINDSFQQNYPTIYASQTLNKKNLNGIDFISIDNNVCVEKSLYDQNPNSYNSNAISQVFKAAKSLVKEKTDLDCSENTPIYIVDNNSTTFLNSRETAATKSTNNKSCIYIKNKYFFEKGSNALAHEFIHASLCFNLWENYSKLPLWLNEGFATQADSQNNYGRDFSAKDLNKLLQTNKYPENYDENLKYYLIHQRLVKLWLDDQGVNVIKKFIELVNSGKKPIDVFYSLGGNNAINKLKNMAR